MKNRKVIQNTLFTDDFPEVNTDKELQQTISKYQKYDPYYVSVGCIKERCAKFDKLWKNFKTYADIHFLKQYKKQFHKRTWEMYLGNVLLKNSFIFECLDEGPDFVLSFNDQKIYIECIAPTKGIKNNPDSVPEMFVAEKPEEILVQDVPVDQMILRITQAIKDKALDQYDGWKSKSWFKKEIPFIIAINTGDLQHFDNPSMPNVVKALFGFQFMQINIKNGKTSYSHRNEIIKSNNAPVPVNYFVSDSFSFVSGILFSDKTILNHPDDIGDDCVFVNNPFAQNPIDVDTLSFLKQWQAEKNSNGITITKVY